MYRNQRSAPVAYNNMNAAVDLNSNKNRKPQSAKTSSRLIHIGTPSGTNAKHNLPLWDKNMPLYYHSLATTKLIRLHSQSPGISKSFTISLSALTVKSGYDHWQMNLVALLRALVTELKEQTPSNLFWNERYHLTPTKLRVPKLFATSNQTSQKPIGPASPYVAIFYPL